MKLFFAVLIGSALYGQDPRMIALIQQRDAQAARVAQRIEFELAHPYAPTPAVTAKPPAPRELTAAERREIHDALDRLAACSTGRLVKDAGSPPLYVPEVDEDCMAKYPSTITAKK
ncbi:MAG: hypothetical protein ABSC23_03960 [Bryobacteraceae bacterium]|jgi:hypothetical protein